MAHAAMRDGLHAWYGTDLDELVRLLSEPPADAGARSRRAEVYKQVLSLLLAQRRPSHYLLGGRDDLRVLSDAHLRLLADSGIIDAGLRDAALVQPLVFRERPPAPAAASFVERKALNAVRAHLTSLLRLKSFYELDRLDMEVETTLDTATQDAVTEGLRRMMDTKGAKEAGLYGERLLTGNPEGVVYSITLFERTPTANLVRVQADNMERPFDVKYYQTDGPDPIKAVLSDPSHPARRAYLQRFFGVITAHVPGPNAKHYRFTSALPTQVIKALEPALGPLVRGTEPPTPRPDGQMLVAEPGR